MNNGNATERNSGIFNNMPSTVQGALAMTIAIHAISQGIDYTVPSAMDLDGGAAEFAALHGTLHTEYIESLRAATELTDAVDAAFDAAILPCPFATTGLATPIDNTDHVSTKVEGR